MDKEKYLEELLALDWDDIYVQLLSYADFKVTNRYFKHGIERRKIARESVQDSIEKLLDRDRDWNRERYPEPIDKLVSMIDTYFSNLFRGKEYNIKGSIDDNLSTDDDSESLKEIIPAGENVLDSYEYDERYKELIDLCIDALDGEEELELVFLEMISGKQDQEIAESLKWKIEKVRTTKKKIRRRLEKIKNELTIESGA